MVEKKSDIAEKNVRLLTTPSLAADLAFAVDNKKSGLVYGQMHQYFSGKISDLVSRANETGRIEKLEAEKEGINSDPSNAPIATQYGIQQTAASLAASMKVDEINKEIEALKEPVAMPTAETMSKLRFLVNDADSKILDMRLYLHQLQNWDELDLEQKKVFLPQLEAIHKEQYDKRVKEREDYYDNAKPSHTRPIKGAPAQMAFEDENGRTVLMPPILPSLPEYVPLKLEEDYECQKLAGWAHSRGKDSMEEYVQLTQEKVDRIMGEYPTISMSDQQIDAEIDKMWEAWGTRTAINATTGLVGVGLTGAAIKLVGVTSKAAMPTAEAYIASQTGITFAETAVFRTAVSQGLKEFTALVPTGLANVGTKATGLVTGLTGGVVAETPIDMGLSAIFEKEGDKSLENFGITIPEPQPGEIDEMVKKEVYKDVNPLTWLSLKAGYEKSFTQTPEFYLMGKTIPSLGVPYEKFEAGVKGEDKEIAERLTKVKEFDEFYDKCAKSMNEYREEAVKHEKQKLQEQNTANPSQPLAATDPNLNAEKNGIAKDNEHVR